ncbi:TLE family member 5-like isoform X3 [Leucoraja erinacea]|uniref:TLE family member 5-like isoform X3 n=1 Tax=Leucoraja erinaceus TaxID=7782 RepID=UPI00245494F1|nr:TLE family member 5-like isoform X3 [Leucoraja erinacea]
MYPQARQSAPSQSAQQLKFTTSDSCDRIKDEFQFLQAQYHSLKLECDKLASEKTEMQRHYVMYYEMSYGLNIEMHKQAEIVKRLNGICAQVIPFLSQEHQQQVVQAIERAKQVTAPELNTVIRVAASGTATVSPPWTHCATHSTASWSATSCHSLSQCQCRVTGIIQRPGLPDPPRYER